MRLALTVAPLGIAFLSFGGGQAVADCASLKTAYERRDCTKQRFEEADQNLNRVYQIIVQDMKKQNARRPLHRLRDTQRQWIKMRDEQCQAEARDIAGGGSEEIRAQYICVSRLTLQRTQKLMSEFRVE